jgi:hypothetical protein
VVALDKCHWLTGFFVDYEKNSIGGYFSSIIGKRGKI